MNNLYRELAPVTEAAWREIELEATRTFKRHVAGRRVVDVNGPCGAETAAVSTGHLLDVDSPGEGVIAHLPTARGRRSKRSGAHLPPQPAGRRAVDVEIAEAAASARPSAPVT